MGYFDCLKPPAEVKERFETDIGLVFELMNVRGDWTVTDVVERVYSSITNIVWTWDGRDILLGFRGASKLISAIRGGYSSNPEIEYYGCAEEGHVWPPLADMMERLGWSYRSALDDEVPA